MVDLAARYQRSDRKLFSSSKGAGVGPDLVLQGILASNKAELWAVTLYPNVNVETSVNELIDAVFQLLRQTEERGGGVADGTGVEPWSVRHSTEANQLLHTLLE